MPRDPRPTVREGKNIARRAAWDTFGRRHWRWFVYGRFIAPVAVLVGIAVPVVAAWQTFDLLALGTVLMATGGLAVFGGVAISMSMSSVRSKMYGRRSALPTVLALAGAGMIVLGALAIVQ